MKHFPALILLFALISSCSREQETAKGDGAVLIKISQVSTDTAAIGIPEYVLISDNANEDSLEAIEIMKVKRDLPLAMQRKDSVLFEKILAKQFTFRAAEEFFTRKDYINNRVNGTWSIDSVKYENLALQFFGNTAVLTYRNTLNGTDDKGNPNMEKYCRADIYVKEDGQWKIAGIHEIDGQ